MSRLRKWFERHKNSLIYFVLGVLVTSFVSIIVANRYQAPSVALSPSGKSGSSLTIKNLESNERVTPRSLSKAVNGDELLFSVEFFNSSKGAKAKDIDISLCLSENSSKAILFESSVSSRDSRPLVGKAIVPTDQPGFWITYENTANWFHEGKYDVINVEQNGDSISFNVDDMLPGYRHGGRAEFRGKLEYFEKSSVTDSSIKDGLKVRTTASTDDLEYSKSVTANQGDDVYYNIYVENVSGITMRNLMIKDNLPPSACYITGSTRVFNGGHPDGIQIRDGVAAGGINVGHYASGSSAKITFKVTLDSSFQPGLTTLTNVGLARADRINVVENECQIRVGK